MGRVELSSSGERALHGERDPVAELHAPLLDVRGQVIAPLGQDVDEERAPRRDHPDGLVDPLERPLQIVEPRQVVLHGAPTVVLPEIEGRIREDAVDRLVPERGKEVEAIGRVEKTEVGDQARLETLHIRLNGRLSKP